MACVTYEARRGLAPGHVVGETYSLPLSIASLTRPDGGDLKEVAQSISGDVEVQYFGSIRVWSVTLAPVRVSEAGNFYEFLRSTADGQTFTFDPYGSDGHPVSLMNVVRSDSGYTDAEFQREGKGGNSDLVSLGFQVREV